MYNEEFLKHLGFTEFIDLNKAQRDNYKRLTAIVYIENHPLRILLIKKNDIWEIEKLLFEGNEEKYNYKYPYPMSLVELINKYFVK